MDGSQDEAASVGEEANGEEPLPSSDVLVPEHRVVSPASPEEETFRAWSLPEERITVPDEDHAYAPLTPAYAPNTPTAMLDYNLDEDDCEFLEKERADRKEYLDQSGLNFI